jgi:ribosomal protein L28
VAGGRWKKRAPHTRKVFKPNLHKWMGMKLCTKCLRKLKGPYAAPVKVATL